MPTYNSTTSGRIYYPSWGYVRSWASVLNEKIKIEERIIFPDEFPQVVKIFCPKCFAVDVVNEADMPQACNECSDFDCDVPGIPYDNEKMLDGLAIKLHKMKVKE